MGVAWSFPRLVLVRIGWAVGAVAEDVQVTRWECVAEWYDRRALNLSDEVRIQVASTYNGRRKEETLWAAEVGQTQSLGHDGALVGCVWCRPADEVTDTARLREALEQVKRGD